MTIHAPVLDESQAGAKDAEAHAVGAVPWPPASEAWRTLWVLALVLALSQIDRNILSLLLQPIKQDLRLSDGQMGLLLGLAFSLVYLVVNFPLARMSDSSSRKVMIAVGVTVWSLATAACGLAQSFWQMFVARAGVGAGEAANGPATYSLLADSFPREKLPRAMAVLNIGFMGGTVFTLIVGGWVIGLLDQVEVVAPVLGPLATWQLAFFVIGLPGLLVALLVLSLREPARQGVKPAQAAKAVPVGEVFAFLARNGRFYGCVFVAVFLNGVISYGTQSFRPAFFHRTYGWTAQHMGPVVGFASLAASGLGLLAGAWLCERLNKTHHDGNMRVAVLAHAIALPFAVAGPLMPRPELAVVCAAVSSGAIMMAAPPQVSALQTVTMGAVRAQVNSLYLLLFSGITGIVGPAFIGWLTDLQHDETRLGWVMAVTSAVLLPLALGFQFYAIRPFGRMIEAIKAEEAKAAA